MDIRELYANAPKILWKSQEKYEQNIIEYCKARDFWVQCVYEYEKSFANEIENLKEEKIAVTLIKEIAKKNCLEKYKSMLEAETLKKKFQYFIKAGEEKINTIKKIMSINTNISN